MLTKTFCQAKHYDNARKTNTSLIRDFTRTNKSTLSQESCIHRKVMFIHLMKGSENTFAHFSTKFAERQWYACIFLRKCTSTLHKLCHLFVYNKIQRVSNGLVWDWSRVNRSNCCKLGCHVDGITKLRLST